MAKTERQRQKKLAKRQKRASAVRKMARIHRNPSTRDIILQALGNPWEIAFKRENDGMASVIAMRRMRVGNPLSVCFLVDKYCCGVKDAFISREMDIDRVREMIRDGEDAVTILTPEYIAKFIQEAVAYARSIGLEPARNTELFMLLFSDVDATKCDEEFVFGKDGKPLFIAGPHDSPEFIERIMSTLGKLGADNFHFVLAGNSGIDRFLRFDKSDFVTAELDLADWDEEYDEFEENDEDEDADVEQLDGPMQPHTVDSTDVRRID